jgi:hypothetical protein
MSGATLALDPCFLHPRTLLGGSNVTKEVMKIPYSVRIGLYDAGAGLGPWGRLCHWLGSELADAKMNYESTGLRWWDRGCGLTPADRAWLMLAPVLPKPDRLDRYLGRIGCLWGSP